MSQGKKGAIILLNEGDGIVKAATTRKKQNEVTLTKKVIEWMAVHKALEETLQTATDLKSGYWLSRSYQRIDSPLMRELDAIHKHAFNLYATVSQEEGRNKGKLLVQKEAQQDFREKIQAGYMDAELTIDVFTVDINFFLQNNVHLMGFMGRAFAPLSCILVGELDEETEALMSTEKTEKIG